MAIKLANNAVGYLTSAVNASIDTLELGAGEGSAFPTLSTGEYFYATLAKTSGEVEVVKVTARDGDVLTVTRAQEGTTGKSFAAGSRVEQRVTAATIEDFVEDGQRIGETLWPRSTAEVTAGVTPADYRYLEGDLRRYGGVGDDSTDNSDALADLALVMAQGVSAYIPVGDFRYSTGWVLPRVLGLSVRGEGMQSVLKYTGSGKAISLSTATVTNIRKPRFQSFMIDCTLGTATAGLELSNAATGNGISFGYFDDLYIYGTTEANSIGLGVYFGFYNQFGNIWVRDFDTCYHIDSDEVNVKRSGNNVFINCHSTADNATYGMVMELGTWGMKLLGCSIEGDGMRYGLHITGRAGAGGATERHVIEGISIEDNQVVSAVFMQNVWGATMIGGVIGTSTTGSGVILRGCKGCEFINVQTGVYDGDVTGTAQAGGADTITLAAGASAIDDDYVPLIIEITGGTGSGQTAVITDYDGTTKVATVADNWATPPDNTSTYSIRRLSIAADSGSFGEFTGYVRDTREFSAINFVSGKWVTRFKFETNGVQVQRTEGSSIARPWQTLDATPAGTLNIEELPPYLLDSSGGDFTITPSSIGIDNEGIELHLKKIPGDTNAVEVNPSSTQTIGGSLNRYLRYDDEALVARAHFNTGGTPDWKVVSHYNPHPYAEVASATSLTLPAWVEVATITGTTGITSISATGFKGRTVRLVFADALTVTDGSNLKLAGNFTSAADAVLTLCCTGTNWYEVSRSTN